MEIILVINTGSTSTKLAIYYDHQPFATVSLAHTTEELSKSQSMSQQITFRAQIISNWLDEIRITPDSLTAIVGRGGLLQPIASGVYCINQKMVADLAGEVYGKHASNLAALLAYNFSQELGIPAFIADPVVVDELQPIARISGSPQVERISIFHALNQKAMARQAANVLEKTYDELNLIVVHLGGGISVGAHSHGQVIDVNNALNGEGPFSPERSGTLPTLALIDYYFANEANPTDLLKKFVGQSGLVDYAGTNDSRLVQSKIAAGDEYLMLVFATMAYQIAKEIGRAAAVLTGEIDAIVLTGGLAYAKLLVSQIEEYISFLARIIVLPGENELEALAYSALRVLQGNEIPKTYE